MDALKIRLQNACELLKKEGFDKAIIGDPMSINYLTGISIIPYERYYGLVVDADACSATMVNPSVDTGCMKGTVKEVTYLDSDGPAAAIREVVGECKKLAVETKYFSMAIGEIFHGLGCEVADIGNCIAKLRMCKDESEIETMQFAAKIVDEAIAYVSDKIKPGMTEKELNMMLYSYMSIRDLSQTNLLSWFWEQIIRQIPTVSAATMRSRTGILFFSTSVRTINITGQILPAACSWVM